jgi:hypothetical protein
VFVRVVVGSNGGGCEVRVWELVLIDSRSKASVFHDMRLDFGYTLFRLQFSFHLKVTQCSADIAHL